MPTQPAVPAIDGCYAAAFPGVPNLSQMPFLLSSLLPPSSYRVFPVLTPERLRIVVCSSVCFDVFLSCDNEITQYFPRFVALAGCMASNLTISAIPARTIFSTGSHHLAEPPAADFPCPSGKGTRPLRRILPCWRRTCHPFHAWTGSPTQ